MSWMMLFYPKDDRLSVSCCFFISSVLGMGRGKNRRTWRMLRNPNQKHGGKGQH